MNYKIISDERPKLLVAKAYIDSRNNLSPTDPDAKDSKEVFCITLGGEQMAQIWVRRDSKNPVKNTTLWIDYSKDEPARQIQKTLKKINKLNRRIQNYTLKKLASTAVMFVSFVTIIMGIIYMPLTFFGGIGLATAFLLDKWFSASKKNAQNEKQAIDTGLIIMLDRLADQDD